MKKLLSIFLPLFLLFQSCKNEIDNKKTVKTTKKIDDNAQPNDNVENSVLKTNLFKNIPTKQFPIVDSTNFDNYEKSGITDNDILKKIKFEVKRENAENFRINYKIPFSENFTTVSITYQIGDHELFTTLITVDNENKIIDTLEISYDEIAESAFQKTSNINRNKIIVTEWNWMSGEPETYILQIDGKFKKIN